MRISVLLPTRGRTETLSRSLDSLLSKAHSANSIEILLGMDRDDVKTIEYVQQHVMPMHPHIRLYEFDRLGYERLHLYVNSLAGLARGYWFLMWGDDALINTANWDQTVDEHQDHPMPLLRMPSENFDHPFALFPIIKKTWYQAAGTISYQMHYDRFLFNVAQNICDGIVIDIPATVTHDRADITGNNRDETFENSFNSYVKTEGNPADPFNDDYPTCMQVTLHVVNRLRKYINDNYGYQIPLIDVQQPMRFIQQNANSHKTV